MTQPCLPFPQDSQAHSTAQKVLSDAEDEEEVEVSPLTYLLWGNLACFSGACNVTK